MSESTVIFVRLALVAWMLAGVLDWWCHRRTHIETTSGLRECAFHWLLIAQGSLGLVIAMLFQPSVLLVICLLLLWAVHQLTTWVELCYVVSRRPVLPIEQMVHSFLEVVPLVLVVVVAIDAVLLASPQVGDDWALRLRDWSSGFPLAQMLLYVCGGAVLVVAPFMEEAWRCYRHR